MTGFFRFVVFVGAVFFHQARNRVHDEFRSVCAGHLEFTGLNAECLYARAFGNDLFHIVRAFVNQAHGV